MDLALENPPTLKLLAVSRQLITVGIAADVSSRRPLTRLVVSPDQIYSCGFSAADSVYDTVSVSLHSYDVYDDSLLAVRL